MDQEEYTSDEGNYSSISSSSGFSGLEDETDFRSTQTDAEKHLTLQTHKHKTFLNVWSKERLFETINNEFGEQNLTLEKENTDLRDYNATLKKEINKLTADKDCQESCISQLKKKIIEQQENIHNLTQQNFKYSMQLSTINNELTTTKHQVVWYKNEWKEVNNKWNSAQKEFFLSKNSLRNKKLEIARLHVIISDFKLQDLTDAKNLGQHNQCSFESVGNLEKLSHTSCDNTQSEKESEIKNYITEIEDLNKEIMLLKHSLTQQIEVFNELLKEKSYLVQENIICNQELENERKQNMQSADKIHSLHEIIDNHIQTVTRKDKSLLEMKSEMTQLKIQLESRMKEKQNVQESIQVTRHNFQKLASLQEELKDEIKGKDKTILELQKKIQDRFMSDNWYKVALEEFATKEADYLQKINLLGEEVKKLSQQHASNDYEIKNTQEKFKLELGEVKNYCKKLLNKNDELNKDIKELYNVLNINPCLSHENIIKTIKRNLVMHKTKLETALNQRKQLELRCLKMAKDNSTAGKDILRLQTEILQLKDLLHVKDIELCDRQKRYELHNRTLLNKIKYYKTKFKTICNQNRDLKQIQLQMTEQLNTKQLKLFQCQLDADIGSNKIADKDKCIQSLKRNLSDKDNCLKEKLVLIDELRKNFDSKCRDYDDLVSMNSISLSTIETTDKCEQTQIFEEMADNIVLKTQHHRIEKLENEKLNALKLVKTLECNNHQLKNTVHCVNQEKLFLNRLIIDMKATLNASGAKQKCNTSQSFILPLNLSQLPCSNLPNELEIRNLCDKPHKKPLGNLKESVQSLKNEMFNMKVQLQM